MSAPAGPAPLRPSKPGSSCRPVRPAVPGVRPASALGCAAPTRSAALPARVRSLAVAATRWGRPRPNTGAPGGGAEGARFPPGRRPGLGYPCGFGEASRPDGRGRAGRGRAGPRARGASRALLTFSASPCRSQFAWPRTRGPAGVSRGSDPPPPSAPRPLPTLSRAGSRLCLDSVHAGAILAATSRVSQRASFLGASSPRTFPRVEWGDKRVPMSLRERWSPGGQALLPQGQTSAGQEGGCLRQDAPGRGPPPGTHPLTGLLTHSPSFWPSLSLTAKVARSLPTTDLPQHLQREDSARARMASGWGQTGDPSQVTLGQLSGSRMRTC